MLKELAAELDDWFVEQAREALREGMASPRACAIRVHGQMALFEREVKLNLVATQDVDVSGTLSGAARKEFERLLAKRGLVLDLTEYLASGPSERFVTLAEKYDVDLEQFV